MDLNYVENFLTCLDELFQVWSSENSEKRGEETKKEEKGMTSFPSLPTPLSENIARMRL